jgi:hypothetical protein
MIMAKATSWALAALIVFAVGTPVAKAGLMVIGTPVDTLTNLEITWGWSPETADTSTPALVNWDVTLQISGDVVNVQDWAVGLLVFHKTNPHPELGETRGDDLIQTFFFNRINDFGKVIDPGPLAVQHPDGPHIDFYTFVFNRSNGSPNTRITLTGVHIPEPSSVTLLSLGCLGLAIPAWRRSRARAREVRVMPVVTMQ